MIKALIGLGNPGSQFYRTRHNIGFRVLDALAEREGAVWKERDNREESAIALDGRTIKLIKPLTFMNDSGKVIPELTRAGIGCENILVIHDELELPLGKVAFKAGGSARGHNGLRSIIAACGSDFGRIRCGIGRPETGEDIASYVLRAFDDNAKVDCMIQDACDLVLERLAVGREQ